MKNSLIWGSQGELHFRDYKIDLVGEIPLESQNESLVIFENPSYNVSLYFES